MDISFVLYGLLLILFLFGVVRISNYCLNFIFGIALLFVVLGYFYGGVDTSFFAVNIFHLLSCFLFLITFFKKEDCRVLHWVLFFLFLEALFLCVDSELLLFYGSMLFFVLLSIIFLFFYFDCRRLLSVFILFSIFYLIIDGCFQYYELGYVFITFDSVFIGVFSMWAVSKIFAVVNSYRFEFDEVGYVKK
ncbi:MAG: hypothetical protein E7354_01990 [Clostridiales bacterium]|nr:hypothetical protein [Clostridiales bacterium]